MGSGGRWATYVLTCCEQGREHVTYQSHLFQYILSLGMSLGLKDVICWLSLKLASQQTSKLSCPASLSNPAVLHAPGPIALLLLAGQMCCIRKPPAALWPLPVNTASPAIMSTSHNMSRPQAACMVMLAYSIQSRCSYRRPAQGTIRTVTL